jgi:hypothetical protein
MKQEVGFIYNRALNIGKYIVCATITGPTPNSKGNLNDESVAIVLESYVKEPRKSQYEGGIPARASRAEEHAKIAAYLDAEGFNDLLCHCFMQDWEKLKGAGEFENHSNAIFDKENCNLAFDSNNNELFDPFKQVGGGWGLQKTDDFLSGLYADMDEDEGDEKLF